MAVFFTDPIAITLTASGAWTDADVSADVPAGATGVLLKVRNNEAVNNSIGLRKKGSTDARTQFGSFTNLHAGFIGVDSNRIFQYFVADHANQQIYLVGYTTTDAVFLTNATDVSTTTTGAWVDTDVSGISGYQAGAVAVYLENINTSGIADGFGVRKKGSTDNRVPGSHEPRHGWLVIGLDADGHFEQFIEGTTADLFVVGFQLSGAVFNTDAVNDNLGSTGAYADLTAVPAGSVGAVYQITNAGTQGAYGFRRNGSSDDIQSNSRNNGHAFMPVAVDANGVAEGIIANTNIDFWQIGYYTAAIQELVPQDLTQSVTLDNASLLLTFHLVADDLSQVVSPDVSTVTQNHIFTTADLTQVTTIDNTILVGVVAVDDVEQAVVFDTANLFQHHVIGPNDMVMGPVLDGTTGAPPPPAEEERPTRFYLANTPPDAAVEGIVVSSNSNQLGGWVSTSTNAIHRKATRHRSGTATAFGPFGTGSTANANRLVALYSTGPLAAQTINGFVKGQIRRRQSFSSDDRCAQLRIRVVSGDGTVTRGLLLDFNNDSLSNEYGTSLANRKYPRGWTGQGAQLTEVTCLAGDRIFIEVGTRRFTTAGSAEEADFRDDAASDLPEDESTTTALNSWIEFSKELKQLTDLDQIVTLEGDVGLLQNAGLVPTGIDQVVSLDEVTIVSVAALAPNDLTQATAIDNSAMSQSQILFIDDAQIDVMIDGSAFATLFGINVDDVIIDLVLDDVTPASTRLYLAAVLPDANIAGIGFGGLGWDAISPVAEHRKATLTRSNTSRISSMGGLGFPQNRLSRVYSIGPMAAQTLRGTVRSQQLVRQSFLSDDRCSQMRIHVINHDGSIVRGLALDFNNDPLSNEWATTLQNRKWPRGTPGIGVTLTNTAIFEGDYILLEIGARRFSNNGSSQEHVWSDTDSFDLPEDDASTAGNSWVEFDTRLLFLEELTPVGLDHVVVVDDTALTQNHLLPSDGLTELVLLDNSELSQSQVLVGTDLTQVVALDDVTPTAVHLLVPIELEQLLSLDDETELFQVHMLGSDGLIQVVVLDDISTGQAQLLVSADLEHAVTLDASAITQLHYLPSDDLFQVTLLDEVALFQLHYLISDGLHQVVVFDNAELVQSQALVSIDLAQALALDASAISQLHMLPATDLFQVVSLDSVNQAQDQQLLPDDMVQVVSLDEATINITFLLVSNDLLQLVLLDTNNISQTHVFTPVDVDHLVLLDTTAISQNHIVTGDDLVQLVVFDTATLFQHQVLVADGVEQVVVFDNAELVQDHQLVGAADLPHDVLIDGSALTQEHYLPSDDLMHAVALEGGLGLSHVYTFTADDLDHDLVYDGNIDMQMLQLLVVQDLSVVVILDETQHDIVIDRPERYFVVGRDSTVMLVDGI